MSKLVRRGVKRQYPKNSSAIGRLMVITQGAVEKHISSIFTKLGLPPSSDDHRRVMAVLAWLEG